MLNYLPNLFSSFNPASSFLNFNWTSMIWLFLLLPLPIYLKYYRMNHLFSHLMKLLLNEMKPLTYKIFALNLMLSLFLMISIINIVSLIPFIFTPTSHMSMTLNLSLPLWLMSMLYGWYNNTKIMFMHLTPESTPDLLIPLSILIESISLLMRPLTLSIRLTANMITGHLLMILLNSLFMSIPNLFIFLLPLELIMLLLETAVALIQAYIFFILILLYTSEVN